MESWSSDQLIELENHTIHAHTKIDTDEVFFQINSQPI
jgi:hypothetical protein